ncbi:MAG: lasso peptide biosynthesis B2 protein [Vicinamibacterales bacterium]
MHSRLLRAWLRWRRLPASERSATLAVAGLVPFVTISLRLIGFPRTLRWIEWSAQGAPLIAESESVVLGEATRALARVRRRTPWTGRCLAQALGLWWILRRRGLTASLSLGVRRTGDALQAHAWVVSAGQVIGDSAIVAQTYHAHFTSATGRLAFRATRRPNLI